MKGIEGDHIIIWSNQNLPNRISFQNRRPAGGAVVLTRILQITAGDTYHVIVIGFIVFFKSERSADLAVEAYAVAYFKIIINCRMHIPFLYFVLTVFRFEINLV